ATVRRAHKVHPLSALQSEYSLLYRTEAEATLPTLRELGISFVAYSPLGRSLLTGSVHGAADLPPDDRRRVHPRFHDDNLEENLGAVDVKLGAEDVRRIGAAVPAGAAAGLRYPEPLMKAVYL